MVSYNPNSIKPESNISNHHYTCISSHVMLFPFFCFFIISLVYGNTLNTNWFNFLKVFD